MGIFSIKNTVDFLLKDKLKSPKFTALSKIYSNWEKIVGQKYLNYSYPSKITLDNEQQHGSLYVVSSNPVASFYLNNNKIYILEKINTFFGYNAIQQMYIIEKPMEIHTEFIKKEKKELTEEQKDKINSINKGKDDALSISLRNFVKSFYENQN